MQDWRKVWEARVVDPAAGSTLSGLMKADGLDTGFGTMPEQPWRRFVADSSSKLGITAASSVFEVGCGAGAYLYELAQSGCRVGGADISAAQIEHIRLAIPEGSWSVGEATETDLIELYDYVLAMGVFLYFPSRDYALDVLSRMAQKATRGIAILDIADAGKKVDAIRFRKGSMGDNEYRARYEGLDHLYLDKQWMAEAFARLGLERWLIEDQQIEGYGNSAYRFNAFAWKAAT